MNGLLKYSLSDADIRNYFNQKINVIKFSELNDYDDIFDVLGPYERCIILFESGKLDTGHWTALVVIREPKKKPYIEFFDSYGIIIEGELNPKYIPKSFQKLSNQKRGTLIKLLLNQSLPVHYSQYRLQELKNGVNTCGKWCCTRCQFNNISEDEFAKLMRSTDYTPDELVCLLYEENK